VFFCSFFFFFFFLFEADIFLKCDDAVFTCTSGNHESDFVLQASTGLRWGQFNTPYDYQLLEIIQDLITSSRQKLQPVR